MSKLNPCGSIVLQRQWEIKIDYNSQYQMLEDKKLHARNTTSLIHMIGRVTLENVTQTLTTP